MECPVCGNKKAKKKLTSHSVRVQFGKRVVYYYHVSSCTNCKEEVCCDDHDKIILKAFDESRETAKINILKYIRKKYGYDIERILGIHPWGQLKEWETRPITTVEFALLLMIRISPLSIEQIHHDFSKVKHLYEYVKIQEDIIEKSNKI